MIRNFLVNEGNPFFPLLMSQFNPGATDSLSKFINFYGHGRDLISFFRLPYDLIITHNFVRNLYDYEIGKLFILQLVAVFFLVIVNPRTVLSKIRKKLYIRKYWCVIGFLFLYTTCWFLSSQQMRFLMPVLATINVLILLACYRLKSFIRNFNFVIIFGLTILGVLSISSVQKPRIAQVLAKQIQ